MYYLKASIYILVNLQFLPFMKNLLFKVTHTSFDNLFFYFRYNAIIRPLKPRMGRPMTILMAVLIWVVAMAIAVPQLLYFTTEYNVQMDSITCIAYWPEGHEFM